MPPATESLVHSSREIQRLNDVIDSTTPDRLRALLKGLSKRTSDNWAHIQSELMVPPGTLKRAWSEKDKDDDDEECEGYIGHAESDYSDEQTEAPASRQRFEICKQCNREYDVLLNDKKSCIWHSDILIEDYDHDLWADHDERCHGPVDTPENRRNHPEGFIWQCCEEQGNVKGCETSRHRPNRAKRVRR